MHAKKLNKKNFKNQVLSTRYNFFTDHEIILLTE